MPNMGYCRFSNTVIDLEDCYDNMDDENLSKEELKAKEKLISLAIDIAVEYSQDIGRDVIEE